MKDMNTPASMVTSPVAAAVAFDTKHILVFLEDGRVVRGELTTDSIKWRDAGVVPGAPGLQPPRPDRSK